MFVYYSSYGPNLHLRRFDRVEHILDDDRYDYGNKCLLKLSALKPAQTSETLVILATARRTQRSTNEASS